MKDFVEQLIRLDDMEWGAYAFSRDPLNGKLSDALRSEMIAGANLCGVEEAKKLRERFGSASIKEYGKKLNLKISYEESDGSDNYIVFAKFNYPDKVTIYRGNIEKVTKLIGENDLGDLLEHVDVENMLLAHEMFHYLEEQNKEIYTRTTKIQLWKLGPLKNNSSLMAVGEIGAMAFARELLGISYSPYVFDTVMLYPHDEKKTQNLVDEILRFQREQ